MEGNTRYLIWFFVVGTVQVAPIVEKNFNYTYFHSKYPKPLHELPTLKFYNILPCNLILLIHSWINIYLKNVLKLLSPSSLFAFSLLEANNKVS
jgi:hypothetical protein